MKIQENFYKIYDELKNEYEGYIQLADKKLSSDFVYKTKQVLKPLDLGNSYVVEAYFFDGDESINIRQVNDDYKVIRVKLSDYKREYITQNEFLSSGYGKVKIATIWKEEPDESCEGFEVLIPIMQLFIGFEDKKGEEL